MIKFLFGFVSGFIAAMVTAELTGVNEELRKARS